MSAGFISWSIGVGIGAVLAALIFGWESAVIALFGNACVGVGYVLGRKNANPESQGA